MISVNMTMIVADLIAVSDAFSLILQQHRIFFLPIVAFAVWYLLVVGDYRKSSRALIWFALAISLISCVIFGLAPALAVARADIQSALKDTGRGTTSGRRA